MKGRMYKPIARTFVLLATMGGAVLAATTARAAAGSSPAATAADGIAAAAAFTSADASDLRAFVAVLCDQSLDGRVVGSAGSDKAAQAVATRFEKAGLKPAGDSGGWFQEFVPEAPSIADAVRLPSGANWGSMKLKNVVGAIPGTGAGSVIVGAHYDHLGRNDAGELFPGADDNASGVAVLCAVATELAAEPPRNRTVVFVAFSGEEPGTLGSQWFAAHPALPLESAIAMVNLDTVGRMENRRLLAFSASSAAELADILRGVNLGFGFDLAVPEKSPIGSDHVSFLAKGVPAFHLFTGANADYHRPTDTPEKLNYEGIAEIASFTAEAVRFLADRERALTFVPPGAGKWKPPAPTQAQAPRRVSLGTIPDMAFSGEGIQVSGVLPGSPAEKAGIKAGDLIVAVDGEKIGGLEDYSAILKSHQPGDKIRVTFARGGAEQTVEAVLVERK